MISQMVMAQDTTQTFSNIDYCEFQKRQNSFNSTDGEIKYIDEGISDNVVLLLHGIPTSGWLYRKMIDSLVAGGLRVIVPDMLGFGSSASPKGYDLYTPEAHAGRLLALMDTLNIDKWCHVCHDFGGMVTWEIFRQDSVRIKELILLNTIIYEDGFNPPVRFNRGPIAHIAMSLYRNRLTNKLMLKQLFKMSLHDTELTKTEFKGYQWPLLHGKTRGMYTFFSSMKKPLPDYSVITKTLDIPVHVIWGKHDALLVWEKQSAAVIADLKIKPENIHIVGASHFVQEEKPATICDQIIMADR
ncbi:MAG: haloalkane dehalogenase [Bacteroidia bacterium]|jgi:haloalkane dehalogenase